MTKRTIQEIPTEELICTIRQDEDDLITFEARTEYTKRTGQDWRYWAPIKPRTRVGLVAWHNFVEEGAS